jgi:hypothetical protein
VAKTTRDRLASLSDEELLAYEREHHGDPYMTLARAKELQRAWRARVGPFVGPGCNVAWSSTPPWTPHH